MNGFATNHVACLRGPLDTEDSSLMDKKESTATTPLPGRPNAPLAEALAMLPPAAGVRTMTAGATTPADSVELRVVFGADGALALAQFVKRIGWSECRALAEDETQTTQMICALHRLHAALAE